MLTAASIVCRDSTVVDKYYGLESLTMINLICGARHLCQTLSVNEQWKYKRKNVFMQ